MTSKYQKTVFDKEKLLRMKEILSLDCHDDPVFIDYNKLKLSIVNGQLCFVNSIGEFMPIARVSTIKSILEVDNGQSLYYKNW